MNKVDLTIMVNDSSDVAFVGGEMRDDGAVNWDKQIGRVDILYTALHNKNGLLSETPGDVVNNLIRAFNPGYTITVEVKK